MPGGEVGALGVAASLVLVAVAVVLSWRGGLGLERTLVWAAARALVQLLLVGAALALVVDPVDAVLVQAVVMYLVLGSAATATAVVARGLVRRLFTPDHRLVHIPRPADG